MTRYFHAANATVDIRIGDTRFRFEPYAHFAGAWAGIFKSELAKYQELLASAADRGVTEITLEEYEACRKKKGKTPDTIDLQPSKQSQNHAVPASRADVASVPVDPPPTSIPRPPDVSDDDLNRTAKVMPAQPREEISAPRRGRPRKPATSPLVTSQDL